MAVSGHTLEVRLIDSNTDRGRNNLTVTLYEYGVQIIDNAPSGTTATPFGSGTGITGTTDVYGYATLTDIKPGVYALVISGAGVLPQIPTTYSRIEVGPLIRSEPDYFQLTNSTGGTHYLYIDGDGNVQTTTTEPS